MDHPKFGIVCVICLTFFLTAVAWAISWGYTESWRHVTNNGYVEKQLEGSLSTMWVKPDGTEVEKK